MSGSRRDQSGSRLELNVRVGAEADAGNVIGAAMAIGAEVGVGVDDEVDVGFRWGQLERV